MIRFPHPTFHISYFIFHLIFRMCSRVSRETLILSIVCMCSRIILGSWISCYDIFLVPPRIFCTLGGLLFHISFWTCSVFMLPAYPYVSLRIRLTSNSWSSVKFILLAGGKGYLWATSESYHNAGNLNFHLWKGTWRRLPCSEVWKPPMRAKKKKKRKKKKKEKRRRYKVVYVERKYERLVTLLALG